MSNSNTITGQADVFALSGVSGLVSLALYVLVVVALWRVFTKAGHPGWLALIPIVNAVFLVKIAGFSGWFTLLYLIPIVGLVFHIITSLRVGRAFGHGAVFSVFLLVVLPLIGFLVIAFSDDVYRAERI